MGYANDHRASTPSPLQRSRVDLESVAMSFFRWLYVFALITYWLLDGKTAKYVEEASEEQGST